MEKDSFCRECIDKYLVEAKKQFPNVDNHLLEICIAQYLLYDVENIDKPDENLKEFVNANLKLEELKKETKEIEDNLKKEINPE